MHGRSNPDEQLSDGVRLAIRQALAGRIDDYQTIVDDETVYCEPCGYELDYTPSVLAVHNVRYHEDDL